MKKNVLIILSLFLVIFYASSQKITLNKGEKLADFNPVKKQIIDTCVISIQYGETIVKDTLNPQKKKNYYMLLQIGKHSSKYSDFFALKSDSIINKMLEEKKSTMEIITQIMPYSKGGSYINIFKNYPEGYITITNKIPLSGYYKFSEEMTKPNWTLENKDSTILGLNCKKASTFFRGRNYTAWYTEEIPISDGPWKFWGLPGLILKVNDLRNEYNFEATVIKKQTLVDYIYFSEKDYYNTTSTTFNKQLKYYYDNPGTFIENSGIKFQGETPKIKSRPYNPIELSE